MKYFTVHILIVSVLMCLFIPPANSTNNYHPIKTTFNIEHALVLDAGLHNLQDTDIELHKYSFNSNSESKSPLSISQDYYWNVYHNIFIQKAIYFESDSSPPLS